MGNLFAGECGTPQAPKCFFGFGFIVHTGIRDTPNCQESCSLFPVFEGPDVQCGSCFSAPAPTPTIAPLPTVEPAEEFNIDLDLGQVPLVDRQIFRRARDKWTDILTTGLVDVVAPAALEDLLWAECSAPSTIDDLYICARYEKIDGKGKGKEGNIVGSGGPLIVRSQDSENPGLPMAGRMRFDEDDIDELIDDGIFEEVIAHETAHVLGLGNLWTSFDLILNLGPLGCFYTGEKANAEYQALSGCSSGIPISECSHWDDACFGREFMTATLESNPVISRISIGALEDLGYQVDYSAADPYSRFDLDFSCRCNRRLGEDGDDEPFHETEHASRQRRLQVLSEEGYQYAYNYGVALLEEEALVVAELTGRLDIPEGITIVADKLVYILYRENGQVYHVLVRRDQ